MKNDYNNTFIRRFNAFLEDLRSKIEKIKLKNKKKDFRMAIIQIVSALVLPGLLPRAFRSFAAVNFEDKKTRDTYVAALIKQYFE